MEHKQSNILDREDILDREERIFKSIQATMDLMESSPHKEVRDTHTALSFLMDEYEQSRKSVIALIDQNNSQAKNGD